MNDILKEKLKVIGEDPYSLLQITNAALKDKIDSSYRNLALKHHPDRTKDPKSHQIFLKMTMAKQLLNDPQMRQQYDHYLATQAQNQRRLEAMGHQRRKLAQDLKQRQKQAQLLSKLQRQQKQRRRRYEQQKQKEQLEKQKLKQQLLKEMKPNEYYKQICSIKMNWAKTGLKFNKKLLQLGFQQYGRIQDVQVNGSEGIIQFQTIESTDKAIKQFQHPLLRVEYLIPHQKRIKLIKVLSSNKKQKLDLSLSSDNLKRLKEIINRNSNAHQTRQQGEYVSMQEILRRQNLYSY